VATGWTVRASNSSGGEIFRTCPDRPWGPLSLLYNGYRVFPGGKERPGRDADPSHLSSAVVMKEQSYTSTPPMGRTACTEPQCLYKGCTLCFYQITCQTIAVPPPGGTTTYYTLDGDPNLTLNTFRYYITRTASAARSLGVTH